MYGLINYLQSFSGTRRWIAARRFSPHTIISYTNPKLLILGYTNFNFTFPVNQMMYAVFHRILYKRMKH